MTRCYILYVLQTYPCPPEGFIQKYFTYCRQVHVPQRALSPKPFIYVHTICVATYANLYLELKHILSQSVGGLKEKTGLYGS